MAAVGAVAGGLALWPWVVVLHRRAMLRTADTLATNAQAIQIVLQYKALPPSQQKDTRQFFINQLIALVFTFIAF